MSMKNFLQNENITIAEKGDWQKWWHYAVPIFFFFVGLFNKKMKMDFYEIFYTCFDDTLYVPSLPYFMENMENMESLIRHEMVHVFDDRRNPFLFKFRYLTSKKWRAYYEYRGYVQNMIVEFEKTGAISVNLMSSMVRTFKSSMYFWMDKNPEYAVYVLSRYVEDGTLKGKYPDAEMESILGPYRDTGSIRYEN